MRVCRSPLRCLSYFLSYEKERIQLLMALCLHTFLWWNDSVFIVGDHDNFPCWMTVRHLPHWVGDLLFFISLTEY